MNAIDSNEVNTPDLLVGAETIKSFLVGLGMPPGVDVYYLRRTRRWPIGSTADGTGGGKLVASRRRLAAHVERLTRGTRSAARS